ncbi:hypothetical protein GOBAR_AA05331 [Gossypium barbadense]|uniref:beta-galactosidase n=1 Tax=Gossypium barbadense TaxID=3634 RepID=A0A2P5YI40_GOSBA|nr:hypothetical protein GOBAR_AA05331 [Gossypium barbadense]
MEAFLYGCIRVSLRTKNDVFMNEMKNFTTLIVDMVKKEKLFASQRGNIILAQVENEYGNVMEPYGDDGKSYINCWRHAMVGIVMNTNQKTLIPLKCGLKIGLDELLVAHILPLHMTIMHLLMNMATIYQTKEKSSCFLSNTNTKIDANVNFGGISYFVPAWSISILPDCREEAYNTAKVSTQTSLMVKKLNKAEDEPSSLKWTWRPELIESASVQGRRDISVNKIVDQKDMANDVSDYLWYMTSIDVAKDDPMLNGTVTLGVNDTGHAFFGSPFKASEVQLDYQPHCQILLITEKEIPLLQAVSTPPQSKTDKPVIYSKDGNVTALIWGASPQSRSDRQKDRVETNPEQLAAASGKMGFKNSTNRKADIVVSDVYGGGRVCALIKSRRSCPYVSVRRPSLNEASVCFVIAPSCSLIAFPLALKTTRGVCYQGLPMNALCRGDLSVEDNVETGIDWIICSFNYGPMFDLVGAGITSPIELVLSKNIIKDLSSNKWTYKVGLNGISNKFFDTNCASKSSSNWVSDPIPVDRNFTWYKTTFKAPLGNKPVVVDLLGLGKGMAWVNGHSLGRYWPSYIANKKLCKTETCDYRGRYSDSKCVSKCSEPTQRWYHVPRSFLKDGENTLVLFEEFGGNPSAVQFQTVEIGSICINTHEGKEVKLSCQDRPISKIKFASFGSP